MVELITGTLGLIVAALILKLIRNDRLHASHGMGWVAVAVGFALLGFAPGIVDKVAGVFGVGYPPVLALMLCIALIIIKMLRMDIEHSRLETRNQRLIQRVAMLELDMSRLQQSNAKGKTSDTSSDAAQVAQPAATPQSPDSQA